MTTTALFSANESEVGCDQVAIPDVYESLNLPSAIMPRNYHCKTKSSMISSSPMSLNLMLGRRNPRTLNSRISEMNKPVGCVTFAQPQEKTSTVVPEEVDYGYGVGYGAGEPGEPQQGIIDSGMKRRRYQRRNSKTPQMLMSMTSSLRTFEFLKELERNESARQELSKSDSRTSGGYVTSSSLHDDLDGGLAIAEELVMNLQKRLKSHR
jgi:hypothetical protein